MPKTTKSGDAKKGELPSTLKKSEPKAQRTFAKTHDSAAEEYGEAQAFRHGIGDCRELGEGGRLNRALSLAHAGASDEYRVGDQLLLVDRCGHDRPQQRVGLSVGPRFGGVEGSPPPPDICSSQAVQGDVAELGEDDVLDEVAVVLHSVGS